MWRVVLTKLSATGTALVYWTYFGPASIYGLAVDASGNAFLTGSTTSADFPTVNAFQPRLSGPIFGNGGDAFITKLDSNGSKLVYSTYLGLRPLEIVLFVTELETSRSAVEVPGDLLAQPIHPAIPGACLLAQSC